MSTPLGEPPAQAEQTVSSRRGFDGKLLHVRVDEIVMPSGRTGVREVVEHPGGVAIIALTAAGDVLLVRQHRHAVGREVLELPAGTRETGEPAAETARRELLEETGYEAESIVELTGFFTVPGYSSERMTLFLARGCRQTTPDLAPDEITEVRPVPTAALRDMLTTGQPPIEDAKTLVGLLWLLAQLSTE